jgi:hypothetical protein
VFTIELELDTHRIIFPGFRPFVVKSKFECFGGTTDVTWTNSTYWTPVSFLITAHSTAEDHYARWISPDWLTEGSKHSVWQEWFLLEYESAPMGVITQNKGFLKYAAAKTSKLWQIPTLSHSRTQIGRPPTPKFLQPLRVHTYLRTCIHTHA